MHVTHTQTIEQEFEHRTGNKHTSAYKTIRKSDMRRNEFLLLQQTGNKKFAPNIHTGKIKFILLFSFISKTKKKKKKRKKVHSFSALVRVGRGATQAPYVCLHLCRTVYATCTEQRTMKTMNQEY